MSEQEVKRNPNDPRRDKAILKYDKDSISKITAEAGQGTSEFFQLITMFIGIYAFMMKVSTHKHFKVYLLYRSSGQPGQASSSSLPQ